MILSKIRVNVGLMALIGLFLSVSFGVLGQVKPTPPPPKPKTQPDTTAPQSTPPPILLPIPPADTAASPAAKVPDLRNPIRKKAKKAALLSAALPGLGQAYNRKYWKIPIIYAGVGTITYYVIWNNRQYNRFKKAVLLRADNNPSTVDEYADIFPNVEQLRTGRDLYRRERDLLLIVGVFVYLLNIADASIDAHLSEFDLSDKLTLRIRPSLSVPAYPNEGLSASMGDYQAGVRLVFSVK